MDPESTLAIQLIVMFVCAIAAAALAHSKGRSGIGWFFGGFFLGLIGLIIVLVLPNLKKQREEKEHIEQENRRLREQIHQERIKSEAFRSHATSRLDVHDGALGLDTKPAHIALPQNPGNALLDASGTGDAQLATSQTTPPPLSQTQSPRQWHYEVRGETNGPIHESQLIELLKNKIIGANSLVWTEQLGDWKKVGDVPALRGFLAL